MAKTCTPPIDILLYPPGESLPDTHPDCDRIYLGRDYSPDLLAAGVTARCGHLASRSFTDGNGNHRCRDCNLERRYINRWKHYAANPNTNCADLREDFSTYHVDRGCEVSPRCTECPYQLAGTTSAQPFGCRMVGSKNSSRYLEKSFGTPPNA